MTPPGRSSADEGNVMYEINLIWSTYPLGIYNIRSLQSRYFRISLYKYSRKLFSLELENATVYRSNTLFWWNITLPQPLLYYLEFPFLCFFFFNYGMNSLNSFSHETIILQSSKINCLIIWIEFFNVTQAWIWLIISFQKIIDTSDCL